MNVREMPRTTVVRWLVMASVACGAASLSLAAVVEPPHPLRLQMDQDVSMEARGHTIATYRATASPKKPFLRELWTPGGVQVLRDSPHDHRHHHGIMFAVAIADGGGDFWSDGPACGRQVPKPLEDVQLGGDVGTTRVTFTQPLDWICRPARCCFASGGRSPRGPIPRSTPPCSPGDPASVRREQAGENRRRGFLRPGLPVHGVDGRQGPLLQRGGPGRHRLRPGRRRHRQGAGDAGEVVSPTRPPRTTSP